MLAVEQIPLRRVGCKICLDTLKISQLWYCHLCGWTSFQPIICSGFVVVWLPCKGHTHPSPGQKSVCHWPVSEDYFWKNVIIICCREGKFITKWFIGLTFVKADNVNVDLTYDIQTFIDQGKTSQIIWQSFQTCRGSLKRESMNSY